MCVHAWEGDVFVSSWVFLLIRPWNWVILENVLQRHVNPVFFSSQSPILVRFWDRHVRQALNIVLLPQVMPRKSHHKFLVSVNRLMTLCCSSRHGPMALQLTELIIEDKSGLSVYWIRRWNGSSINMPVEAWLISAFQILSVHSIWSPVHYIYQSLLVTHPIFCEEYHNTETRRLNHCLAFGGRTSLWAPLELPSPANPLLMSSRELLLLEAMSHLSISSSAAQPPVTQPVTLLSVVL